ARLTDRDRHLLGIDLHAILAGAHRVAPAVDRILELEAEVRIAVRSVDDGPGEPLAMRDRGQNVAPDGRVLPSAVVEHDDGARLEVVDVVADGTGLSRVHRAV